jgi:hypothetical protein
MTLQEAIDLINDSGSHVVVPATLDDSCAHFRRKPPKPVARPNEDWCDEYTDWYDQHMSYPSKK